MSRRLASIASLVLFALACALPAVDFDKACSTEGEPELAKLWQAPLGTVETSRGLWLLAGGALGVVFLQTGAFGWLANPFYGVGVLLALLGRRAVMLLARMAALAALALAAISLLLTNVWPLPADEGGVCRLSAIAPRLGYWLWLFAIVALCVAAFRPDAEPPVPPAR